MVVLLPEKVGTLSQLEEKLTTASLHKWTASLVSQETIVYLPKFKTTTGLQLSETLKSMGMVSAFDATTADFSMMTGGRDLFISAVIHKAFVDVNEEGTEAAAATDVAMTLSAAPFRDRKKPPVFRADHPFIFLIRDDRTGVILFLGRMIDPSK
jgi:serpin B